MSSRQTSSKRSGGWSLGFAAVLAATPLAASTPHREFMSANDAAMIKMMADMDIKPSGDVDRDFVNMMIPHHQGGIDMAIAELRYGKNEQLRRLAQEIIVAQQQEIAAMRLAVGQPPPPSNPSPTTPAPHGSTSAAHHGQEH
ncbi:MAG: DUF305 domain-containing protein [Caulobacter sp.]|nr:DUF305 domain-containing protein [Caulobacter sp.]